jgi:hypothetical protein
MWHVCALTSSFLQVMQHGDTDAAHNPCALAGPHVPVPSRDEHDGMTHIALVRKGTQPGLAFEACRRRAAAADRRLDTMACAVHRAFSISVGTSANGIAGSGGGSGPLECSVPRRRIERGQRLERGNACADGPQSLRDARGTWCSRPPVPTVMAGRAGCPRTVLGSGPYIMY